MNNLIRPKVRDFPEPPTQTFSSTIRQEEAASGSGDHQTKRSREEESASVFGLARIQRIAPTIKFTDENNLIRPKVTDSPEPPTQTFSSTIRQEEAASGSGDHQTKRSRVEESASVFGLARIQRIAPTIKFTDEVLHFEVCRLLSCESLMNVTREQLLYIVDMDVLHICEIHLLRTCVAWAALRSPSQYQEVFAKSCRDHLDGIIQKIRFLVIDLKVFIALEDKYDILTKAQWQKVCKAICFNNSDFLPAGFCTSKELRIKAL